MRSTPFRIAVAFACAVTLVTYAVFAFVYLQFYRSNVAVVRANIVDEVYKSKDLPADRLVRRLELRLSEDLRHIDYVGLYNGAGVLTLGNAAPTLNVPTDGKAHLLLRPLPRPDAARSEEAYFAAGKTADGGTLVLGRSLVYVQALERAMMNAFIGAIAPIVLLALLIGLIVSRRASLRLGAIQEAINRVMHGELTVRLPACGTPDDVDRLVRQVNRMLDEIGRLVGQIRSVGDNIAHDLRAPLAVMRARLERGLAGSSETDLRRLVGDALSDLEKAMATVTALLRISELESGARRRGFSRLDLAVIAREVVELYAPLAAARNIDLTLEAPEAAWMVGDGDLLREALANLIDNAVKFTPSGGMVSMSCGTDDVLVRVRDTGPGIAADERDKVVRRFYRSPRTSSAPGLGLGLSMATTIVELHGFGLRISDACPGACFEILLQPKPRDGRIESERNNRRRVFVPFHRRVATRD